MTDGIDLTISARQKQPSALRLISTLAIAAALSGLAIASVYQITKPIIAENKALELKAAIFEVVPGATVMQEFILPDKDLVVLTEDVVTNNEIIYGAYDNEGQFVGYAIQGDTPGFQDKIRLLYGYDPKPQRVTGIKVLDSKETPGLGDKIWKDEAFVANFRSLAVDPPIIVVKGKSEADNEVDAITGATISSKAVVKIINEGNARWLDRLPAVGEEPALNREAETSSGEESDAATNEEEEGK